MSVENFVKSLQENDVDGAISSLKSVLQTQLDESIKEKRKVVLESFGFVVSEKKCSEEEDEMDDKEDEESEGESDEEEMDD